MHLRHSSLVTVLAAGLFVLPAGGQEIVYLSNSSESTPFVQAMRQLTEEYAAETGANATFSFDASNQANIMQRVQILAASNSLPIIFTLPDLAALEDLYESGQILDIRAKFMELGIYDSIDPFFVERLQNSEAAGPDVLYELPLASAIEGITYNKAIFAEHGLEVPTTWEEFLVVNQTLLDAGIQPITAGGGESWPLLRWISMYVYRLMGNDIIDRVRADEVPLTEPGFAEAVSAIVGLTDAGYFGPAVTTMTFGQSLDQFRLGQAAMIWGGSFIPPLLEGGTVPIEDVGFFNFPSVPDGVGDTDAWIVTGGLTTSIATAAYESDPEAYDAWMQYVFPRFGDKALEMGFLSGFSASMPFPEDDPLADYRAALETVSAGLWPWEQHFSSRAFIMAGTTIPLVVNHSLSVEQYLADLEAANQ